MSLNRTKQGVRAVGRAVIAFSTKEGKRGSLRKLLRKTISIAATEGLAGIRQRVIVLSGLAPVFNIANQADVSACYERWQARFDSLRPADVRSARRHLETLALPEVLIVLVITRADLVSLPRLVSAWGSLVHPGWHGVIVPPPELDDGELDGLQTITGADPRLSIMQDPSQLESLRARRPWTLFCFGRVLLNPLSTYFFLEAAEQSGAAILYGDHDVIDPKGGRVRPAFKPQYSPLFLTNYNYIGHCILVSRAVPLSLNDGLRLPTLDEAGIHDLIRSLCADRRVEHVPFILSHALDETSGGDTQPPTYPDDGFTVAIIIPTRDGVRHLKPCIESILSKTTYDLDLVELVIVDNGSVDPATLAWMDEIATQQNVSVKRYPKPFNFAAINNFGADGKECDVLVFLNDDTTVLDGAWLSKLVFHSTQPGVGVVGAKLLFPDGTVQHGGCAAGDNMGTVKHLLMHAPLSKATTIDHTREMSIVTGACCAIRREIFEQIGGFDEVLKITWNDVKFCLDCLQAGYRNVYVADALLYHDESKTRGNETTPEKIDRYFTEAHYTRRRFREIFYDDPSYNPNFSVSPDLLFAEPPRVRRPWVRSADRRPRILILSTVYAFGFGVSIVIQQQVLKLIELGYDVVIGGPKRENELVFPGCERVYLQAPREAAIFAWETDVSLIVAHTPPYFEIPVFIGGHIPVLSYDYGEPPAELFPDPVKAYLLDVTKQKRSSAALTTLNATISRAVKEETSNDDAVVLGLANSHLRSWSDALLPQRRSVRARYGWENAFVVLNVCRFSANERQYKGLDKVARIAREFPFIHPKLAENVVWALAGAGSPDDVREVEALGFTVFPNLPDADLADLYLAADSYMSFSRWEGYNLGIGQSLAMGLPTLASDIPAHREFPIVTTDSTLVACNWLAEEVVGGRAGSVERKAVIFPWEASATRFAETIGRMVDEAAVSRPRSGASQRSAMAASEVGNMEPDSPSLALS